MAKRILMPLPDRDFDTTEVAVPWKMLHDAGHDVVFSTEGGGAPAQTDPLTLNGVLFGQLGAEREPRAWYRELITTPEYQNPISWDAINVEEFDGVLLPGGHAQGMRQYLGSEVLQRKVARFFAATKAVGAICHGVLVAARARDERTGRSVLAGHRTTCLPRYMEAIAYGITFWKLGRYYRTYDAYVETEVRAALDNPDHFIRGPISLIGKGTLHDDGPAFVVQDGNYVSARWPGDAYLFARRFIQLL